MAGLVKAKKYDWKDSNLALFGSDTEKKVKKASAECEPAWKSAGKTPGLQIWRIVKFKVTDWPKEDCGQFYSGDSYIILNTYKKEGEDELLYDVHFWIGKYSSQDEYGTAAYKTVELDTYLDDKPIQHREVQGHESTLFKSYFPTITLLKGGASSGFRHVSPTEYKPRLFKFCGNKRHVEVTEIGLKDGNLTSDDVFTLDTGLVLYQFNGKNCSKEEKFRATQWGHQIRSERGGKPKISYLEENSTSRTHQFYKYLKSGKSKAKAEASDKGERRLYRLSDSDGHLQFKEIAKGDNVNSSQLDSDDVFIFDRGDHCFVWVGSAASIDERRNSLTYAHNYLLKQENPLKPITVVSEGKENEDFKRSM